MLRNPLSAATLALALALAPSSVAQTTVSYGTTTTGNLPSGGAHTYQFVGVAGESVRIWATRHRSESASFDPCVELRNPDGSTRAKACARGTQNRVSLRLQQSGVHQIVITDEPTFVRAGAYTLTVQRICPTASPNARNLAFGQTVSASLSPEGDIDVYTFTAGAGVPIRLTATKGSGQSGSYSACLNLFAPDCTLIGSPCSSSNPNVIDHTTTMSGVYVAFVYDEPSNPRAVSYSINLQCMIGNCASTADYTLFGTGCVGTVGIPALAPATGEVPVLGSTFTIELTNLPPSPINVPVMFTGASNTNWLGVPLPHDLTYIGMAGCSMLASWDIATPLANIGGTATWTVNIPLDTAFLGVEYYNQGLVLDSGANNLGMIVTNGGRGVIG